MLETTANEFRKKLKSEVDKCIRDHEVLKVKRRNGENFVVLGEDDWRAVEETLYLNQFPGLVDSIHKAESESLSEGTSLEEIDL
ncbi:MAG: type II toxin-antitoxin system Phd/YefM family antitoxin [Desulfobulbaceae bacterium]|nr:type II toxin-antitoxin system Phd/YefM family antitoxin [Desulfobulbaceae bacterium]